MRNRSDPYAEQMALREQLIGLGETSHRKSYYPELQRRLEELERFNAFLDYSNDAIFLVKVPGGTIVDFNDAASRQTGWEKEQLLQKSIFEISGLAQRNEAQHLFSPAAEVKGRGLIETKLFRRDGGLIPVEMTLARMLFGESAYVIAVARDISKRKLAEEALAERVRLAELGADIGKALTMGRDSRDVLQRCAESLTRHTEAAFGRIWVVSPEDPQVLVLKASAGMYTSTDGRHSRKRVGEFKVGAIAREGKPLLTNAVLGDPGIIDQDWARREGMVAFAGYPLVVNDRTIGVIALFFKKRMTDAVLSTLASVADQIAVGIDRQRAEKALRESERKLRAIIDQTFQFIGLMTLDGSLMVANRAALKFIGVEESEVTGKKFWKTPWWAHSPDLQTELRAAVKKAAKGEFVRFEATHQATDGGLHDIDFSLQPVRDEAGEVVLLIAEGRDITERKRAEEMVRNSLAEAEASRDKIAAIVKSVPNGLIVTDLTGRITLMNRAAEKLLGRSQKKLSQKFAGDILQEELFVRHLEATLAGEVPATAVELELMDHGRGEVRTFQVGTSLVRSKAGVSAGAVILLRDVTREREIAHMKDEFISTAAHEFNTPLTVVMGYLELLMKQTEMGQFSAAEQGEFLSVIYEKSEALSRIVDGLLQISQTEAGQPLPLEKSSFEIQITIREVVDLFSGSSAHPFELDLPEEPIKVFADPVRMAQVLENLLSNAVKYSPDGGPIRIVCTSANDEVRISVQDEGIGMTAEQVKNIFEKFYRADASNTALGGIGLGLSVARNIVEAHSGRIWVVSRLKKGTRITFTIPGIDVACG